MTRQSLVRISLVSILTISVSVASFTPVVAAAEDELPPLGVNMQDKALEISGARKQEPSGGRPPAQPAPALAPPVATAVDNANRSQVKHEPVCIADLNNISVACVMINDQCSVGVNGTLMRVLEAPAGQTPPVWSDTGSTTCRYSDVPSDDRPIEEGDDLPVVTAEFFRRLPIAPSGSSVEPVPHTLVGAETNVYADPNLQTFIEDIEGHRVTLRAIPTSYTWNYGDGALLGPVNSPGGALPPDHIGERTETSHVYTATGDVRVTLTTSYRGEYSFNGTDWIGIDGEANVVSPSVGVSVWRSVVNNFADNCMENPNGAGC